MAGTTLPDLVGGAGAPSLGDQKHAAHHNEARQRLAEIEAAGAANRRIPADYLLTRSGTTYTLTNGRTGATTTGSEPGTLMQSAMNALGLPAGEIVIAGPENMAWGAVPQVPAGITGKLTIRSIGPKVILSAAGPRFLDPGTLAIGSTLQNVELDGIVVDATAIAADTTFQHLIFGSWRGAGGNQVRWNLKNITVRNCHVVGAGTDGNQFGVYFQLTATAAGQAQLRAEDILVENCSFNGCRQGVSIVGHKDPDFVGDANIWGDRIMVDGWHHTLRTSPQGFAAHSHIHFGSAHMKLGKVTVRNGYGFGTRDVGVEIDQAMDALVENCHFDEFHGYAIALTNFIAPTRTRDQKVTVRGCSGRHLAANNARSSADSASVVGIVPSGTIPMGHFVIDDLKYYSDRPSLVRDPRQGIAIRFTAEARSLSVKDAICEWEGINHTEAGTSFAKGFYIAPVNKTPVSLRRMFFSALGTAATGAGANAMTGFQLSGSMVLDADDLAARLDIANNSLDHMEGLNVGAGMASNIEGSIRRFKVLSAADRRPIGISVMDTDILTIPTKLTIKDADLAGLPANSTDIWVRTGNMAKVPLPPGSVWKQARNPVAVTVGTSPFVYRNTSGFRQQVVIRAGTVSEVAYSLAGATYTVIATATGVIVTLDNGEHLRITYSAAPTVTALPVL